MMSQERFMEILRGLPAVHLDIFDITRKVIGENGELDPQKISFYYKEIEAAVNQAESYGKSTRETVQCLLRLAR